MVGFWLLGIMALPGVGKIVEKILHVLKILKVSLLELMIPVQLSMQR